MSHTVSAGFQRMSRWSGVAASVAEYLGLLIANTHHGTKVPIGTIRGFEQFFDCVREGFVINRNQGRRIREIRIMAAICCYDIAVEVMTGLDRYHSVPAAETVDDTAMRHRAILRRILAGASVQHRMEEVKALFEFTNHLMQSGSKDAESELYEPTDKCE